MKQFQYITSMTGYGRGECEQNEVRFVSEIRSVNHRYLHLSIRYPSGWSFLEEEIRRLVKKELKRGKVDLTLSMDGLVQAEKRVEVNWELVHQYVRSMEELKNRVDMKGDVLLSDLLQLPDIWIIHESQHDVSCYRNAILDSVKKAVEQLVLMRKQEGDYLGECIYSYIMELQAGVMKIKKEHPLSRKRFQNLLREKLKELQDSFDENRILTEIVLFTERTDISEEIARLESHIHQFQQTLSLTEPIGRRLDFLLQEMNREVNTIGSKSQSTEISSQVIESKSILEKIKEQVQNIE